MVEVEREEVEKEMVEVVMEEEKGMVEVVTEKGMVEVVMEREEEKMVEVVMGREGEEEEMVVEVMEKEGEEMEKEGDRMEEEEEEAHHLEEPEVLLLLQEQDPQHQRCQFPEEPNSCHVVHLQKDAGNHPNSMAKCCQTPASQFVDRLPDLLLRLLF
jgi:hypothetical protein